MERSVRRSELESDDTSEASTAEPIVLDRLRTLNDFHFIEATQPGDLQIEEVDELSFRLFAPSKAGDQVNINTTHLIRIRSPTPDSKDAGFIRQRDLAHYFSSADAIQFQSAVSAQDVHKLASIKWYGSANPWKILELPASALAISTRQQISNIRTQTTSEGDAGAKRRRLGKKARIKLRVRLAASKQDAVNVKMAQAAQEAKDAAERKKKTRKNREKQAKKRLRAKAKMEGSAQDDLDRDDSDQSAG